MRRKNSLTLAPRSGSKILPPHCNSGLPSGPAPLFTRAISTEKGNAAKKESTGARPPYSMEVAQKDLTSGRETLTLPQRQSRLGQYSEAPNTCSSSTQNQRSAPTDTKKASKRAVPAQLSAQIVIPPQSHYDMKNPGLHGRQSKRRR